LSIVVLTLTFTLLLKRSRDMHSPLPATGLDFRFGHYCHCESASPPKGSGGLADEAISSKAQRLPRRSLLAMTSEEQTTWPKR
ncbi:MAG: hypothetical protein KAU60_02095, partial [Desulfobacterales bacterium]|nr:hypothetical protein [Desulfobacterales bacterium]